MPQQLLDIPQVTIPTNESRTYAEWVSYRWCTDYKEYFNKYDEPEPEELILSNFSLYHPYTNREFLNDLLEYKPQILLENENLNDDDYDERFKLKQNKRTLETIEKGIGHENLKVKWFTGRR